MRLQAFQPFERRDENDNIIRSGAYGKHTPLATRDNMGIIDYIGNNFDAIVSLLDLIKGGLNIKGAYGSLHELQAAHPTGNAGDAYMVSGHLYAWVNNRWTDLGNIQGPQGEPGPKGNDGTSLTVKGKYNSLYELQAAHPTGNLGDAYMVGMNMYVWTGAEWSDMGNITGPRGERGPKGDRGDVGPQGPQGLQGEQGIQGPSGRTGERGTQGPIGAVGPKGEKGDVGPRGLQGEQGPRGPQGLQGNVGPQGPRGERGPKGEQGTGLVVRGKYNSLYELQTAHPTANDGDAYLVGTDLYVWVSGTWTNMGSLQGPKGDKGERGPQGVQGNAGPKGESGQPGTSASITGATASVDNTSVVPSVEVVTGGTYYTRSFDFRFKGLKGPKGDKGDVGPRGPQGLKGDTGAVGPQGPQGLTGPAGPRGPQGEKGDRGATGPQGATPPVATTSEATAGTDNTKMMTPLRVKEAIEAFDNTPVGDVAFRPFLKAGYVKANGATVNRADYPRLVAFANANNLWTTNPANEPWKFGQGNGSTTMVLPNYVGRFIQGGDTTGTKQAGLPNITGEIGDFHTNNIIEKGAFKFSRESRLERGGPSGKEVYICMSFDASRCSNIYGASTTVQPLTVVLIPQLRY